MVHACERAQEGQGERKWIGRKETLKLRRRTVGQLQHRKQLRCLPGFVGCCAASRLLRPAMPLDLHASPELDNPTTQAHGLVKLDRAAFAMRPLPLHCSICT
jgi:hypothetical protein